VSACLDLDGRAKFSGAEGSERAWHGGEESDSKCFLITFPLHITL